jgi:hypothetical protein
MYIFCNHYMSFSAFDKANSIHSLVFSPYAGLAGTITQSGDRYGSGTLHPGQVLRGRLPLLSPTNSISYSLIELVWIGRMYNK